MTHIPPIRGRLIGAEVEYFAPGGAIVALLTLDDLRLLIMPETSPALVFALRTAAGAWWAARGTTLRVWSGGAPRTVVLGARRTAP